MAKLVISFEGAVIKTIPLNKDRVTIGRRPENDIQVDNLGVSGEHAVIVTMGNDCVVEDMKSTNGTLVNGQLTEKRLLQNNDVIEIGKHKMKFVVEAVAAGANFEKTMVIRRPGAPAPAPAAPPPAPAAPVMRGDDPTPATILAVPKPKPPAPPPAPAPAPAAAAPAVAPAAPAMPKPTPAPAPAAAAPAPAHEATTRIPPAPQPTEGPSRPAMLQVLSGDAAGRELELTKSLTTIGKKGVQVVVFTRRPTGYFVTHVEGAAPVFNGAPLGPEARQLKDNDTIEITGIKMAFFYKS